MVRLFSQWYLILHAQSGDPAFLQAALDYAKTNAELYPASNSVHARLAAIQWLAGDEAGAKSSAETALELDTQNPHQEWKLYRRTMPQMLLDTTQSPTSLQLPQFPQKNITAEQWLRDLRSGST